MKKKCHFVVLTVGQLNYVVPFLMSIFGPNQEARNVAEPF